MAKNTVPLHIRKANLIANWEPGDDSETARILTTKMRLPTVRNSIHVWRRGGYSKLEAYYIEAMERAQKERIAKRATAATAAT